MAGHPSADRLRFHHLLHRLRGDRDRKVPRQLPDVEGLARRPDQARPRLLSPQVARGTALPGFIRDLETILTFGFGLIRAYFFLVDLCAASLARWLRVIGHWVIFTISLSFFYLNYLYIFPVLALF